LHFLLAASPRSQPNRELFSAYSAIAPCTSFQCPTQIFGYPQGPTAMYWDAMEFVAQRFSHSGGFCLWMESDMAPIKPDWLDRLSHEWYLEPRPLMMGCFVPDIYKRRIFRRPKLLLNAHINGGACYATDFVRYMPQSARQGVFDMAVYRYAKQLNRVRATRQIAFSTIESVRRDLMKSDPVLLHGYLQDKDVFIDRCLEPISDRERFMSVLYPLHDHLELFRKRLRVQFVRRGQRAMLENLLLTKRKTEAKRRAA
jgi:hypothetical protein